MEQERVSDGVVTDEEAILLAVAIWCMTEAAPGRVRIRESWPEPSPWRWLE